MLRRVPLLELPRVVAELGYEYIELSPRSDFMPFFVHPRADRQTIDQVAEPLDVARVEVWAVVPLSRWAVPDEDEPTAAVRYWMRVMSIALHLVDQKTN